MLILSTLKFKKIIGRAIKVVLFHNPNSTDIMFKYSKCSLKLIKFYEVKYLSKYFRLSLIKTSEVIIQIKIFKKTILAGQAIVFFQKEKKSICIILQIKFTIKI